MSAEFHWSTLLGVLGKDLQHCMLSIVVCQEYKYDGAWRQSMIGISYACSCRRRENLKWLQIKRLGRSELHCSWRRLPLHVAGIAGLTGRFCFPRRRRALAVRLPIGPRRGGGDLAVQQSNSPTRSRTWRHLKQTLSAQRCCRLSSLLVRMANIMASSCGLKLLLRSPQSTHRLRVGACLTRTERKGHRYS